MLSLVIYGDEAQPTCLQPESGGRHYAQSAASTTGKWLTPKHGPIYTPFWTYVEGPPFVNHSKFQEDFGVAPVIGVSGVATTGRIWAESQKFPLVIGGIRTGNLASSYYEKLANTFDVSAWRARRE